MRYTINTVIDNVQGVGKGIATYVSVKVIPSVLIPMAAFLFGIDNISVLKMLMALIMIDFITGVTASFMSKEVISSHRAIRSAYKVVVYWLLVASAHLAGEIVPIHSFLDRIIISFLGVTELISIIENTGKMGYVIPKKLLNKLVEYRDSQ